MKNIHNNTPRTIAALSIGIILSLVAGRNSVADTVVQANGVRKQNVQITKASYDQVLYSEGGNTFQLAGDRVASIERDSAVISRIRGPLEAGDYAKAMAQVKRAETGVQGWELAEVQFLKGKVFLEAGKFREADQAFSAYITANEPSKDYWIPHAVEGRGLAALARNNPSTAAQHFKSLAGYGPTWKVRATLGEAESLVKKNPVKARELFRQVASSRSAPPAQKAQATVGRIRVMVLEKQYDAAIKELEKRFFENPEPALMTYGPARAKASHLMGLSYKAQGGKENLEKAEIWFLRTAVLYRAHPAVYRDACTDLAEVYDGLNRKDRAAEWRRRAGTSS